MKILYLTLETEDVVEDSVLYGLRKLYGPDVVDFPKKDCMYIGSDNRDRYGQGFTLWGLLPDLKIDREHIIKQLEIGYYDVIIFANIYRQQDIYTHWVVYLLLERAKKQGKKIVFIDGSDDGKPTVIEAFNWGTYFKRDNPYQYPQVKMIGISIPEVKIRTDTPTKTRLFSSQVQCEDAYAIKYVADNCKTRVEFATEEQYYADLASSLYGIVMKRSGWDCPRYMENAANWSVNCIYTKGWEWDNKSWYDKPDYTYPLGLVDMKNCILWDNPKQLIEKIDKISKEGLYPKIQEGSLDWVKGRTCEKMAKYVMENI